jgi:hypothetical protein
MDGEWWTVGLEAKQNWIWQPPHRARPWSRAWGDGIDRLPRNRRRILAGRASSKDGLIAERQLFARKAEQLKSSNFLDFAAVRLKTLEALWPNLFCCAGVACERVEFSQ